MQVRLATMPTHRSRMKGLVMGEERAVDRRGGVRGRVALRVAGAAVAGSLAVPLRG